LQDVNEVRSLVLRHLNADADKYSLVFTSNASAALHLLASSVNWQHIYAHNSSHTSVLGMGTFVAQKRNVAIEKALHILTDADFDEFHKRHDGDCLAAFPAQCNFSGVRYPLRWIDNVRKGKVKVLVDAASFLSSQSLDLTEHSVDFLVLSFYKLFGFPTGLGALIVRKECDDMFHSGYVGGGTVDFISVNLEKSSPSLCFKKKLSLYERFEIGTVPFQEILAVRHGFNYIYEHFGGFKGVGDHSNSLVLHARKEMSELKYPNGNSLCELYPKVFKADQNGPIVSFNLLLENGSYIGYSTVDKLAAINNIHLRSGCFCNPGACQFYLDLKHDDVIYNHEVHGHTCGDGIDIIQGKPTGALRISFGFCNILDDVTKWIDFLSVFFMKPQTFEPYFDKSLKSTVHAIYIYPIKSCGAFKLKLAKVSLIGLQYDRIFKLVDLISGKVMTQKRFLLLIVTDIL
jgi:molybdenum cofactor sulfurtransferase